MISFTPNPENSSCPIHCLVGCCSIRGFVSRLAIHIPVTFSNNSQLWDSFESSSRSAGPRNQSLEERIVAFDKTVEECKRLKSSYSSTFNFKGKSISRASPVSLDRLEPITIDELQIGVTHKKPVLFARIVSKRPMKMSSIMVLVEDHDTTKNEIADLAVYGLYKESEMRNNRCLAIIEPHYKLREDGSLGIRVDNIDDIVFDATYEATMKQAKSTDGNVLKEDQEAIFTLETRLKQMFMSDPELGVDKAFHKVTQEGFDTTKKQVRALKKAVQKDNQCNNTDTPKRLPLVLSERRPEDHRVYTSSAVLDLRSAGKEAFEKGDYQGAEEYFSKAIAQVPAEKEQSNEKLDSNARNSVARWQLIGNLSATRYKLGKLDESFQDALRSNRCAPRCEIKPILRCAEIMSALGMKYETIDLLKEASVMFPDHQADFVRKNKYLEPTQQLFVGPDKQYKTILGALRDAPAGAEILVDPGIYVSEPIIINKALTLRSSKQVFAADTLSEETTANQNDNARPEICVKEFNAISCNTESTNSKPLCIDGFKISCSGHPQNSFHSLGVFFGIAVVRNCILTSSSGPVVCVDDRPLQPLSSFLPRIKSPHPPRLIIHSCKVCDGPQGGVLCVGGSILSLRQVHVSGNAASGLELRAGGTAKAENCSFYDNGRQGINIWMSAGRFDAKHCWIHSNSVESGALVSEAEAHFENCEFYGNGAAGCVAQKKGLLYLTKCLVHDNNEGILIQDTASADVQQCEVYRNRANGIFVGFDHVGYATIRQNHVHSNFSVGILIGNRGKHICVEGNKERNNKGQPPQMPGFMRERLQPSRKHQKRMNKNKATIQQAMQEFPSQDGIVGMMHKNFNVESLLEQVNQSCCLLCGTLATAQKKLLHCSKCQEAMYCSRECQVQDWPRHKKMCRPKNVKYPSFLDGKSLK